MEKRPSSGMLRLAMALVVLLVLLSLLVFVSGIRRSLPLDQFQGVAAERDNLEVRAKQGASLLGFL